MPDRIRKILHVIAFIAATFVVGVGVMVFFGYPAIWGISLVAFSLTMSGVARGTVYFFEKNTQK